MMMLIDKKNPGKRKKPHQVLRECCLDETHPKNTPPPPLVEVNLRVCSFLVDYQISSVDLVAHMLLLIFALQLAKEKRAEKTQRWRELIEISSDSDE